MQSKKLMRYFTCGITALLMAACRQHSLEGDFFYNNINAHKHVELLRAYSLEDQYKIFRFGEDVVHPSASLTAPIAERGAAAMPFMLHQMEIASDDASIGDNMAIFEDMATAHSYNVKGDKHAMEIIEAAFARIKHPNWKERCLGMLNRIKSH